MIREAAAVLVIVAVGYVLFGLVGAAVGLIAGLGLPFVARLR